MVASSLDDTELKKIRAELLKVPQTSLRIKLEPVDWIGALAVFLLVFFSTIPVILPFLFMQDALVALQISNAIAVTMMLVLGYTFGKLSGYNPWIMAGSMVLVGSVVVALTIALGG